MDIKDSISKCHHDTVFPQTNNATMLLDPYQQGQTRLMLPDIWGFAQPLLTDFGCVTTTAIEIYQPRSTAKERSCLTMASKLDRFLPNIARLRHPGSQSSSKEPSASNTTGTVTGFTELMAKNPPNAPFKMFFPL